MGYPNVRAALARWPQQQSGVVMMASAPRADPAGRWLPPSPDAVDIERLPLIVNLTLYGGDDFALIMAVTEPDGSPVDLDGASARAQVRAEPSGSSPVLAEFTAELGSGLVTLHLAAADAEDLPQASVYDCKLDHGITTTLVAGDITMFPQVTRHA